MNLECPEGFNARILVLALSSAALYNFCSLLFPQIDFFFLLNKQHILAAKVLSRYMEHLLTI